MPAKRRGKTLLYSAGAPNLGVVLSDVDLRKYEYGQEHWESSADEGNHLRHLLRCVLPLGEEFTLPVGKALNCRNKSGILERVVGTSTPGATKAPGGIL